MVVLSLGSLRGAPDAQISAIWANKKQGRQVQEVATGTIPIGK